MILLFRRGTNREKRNTIRLFAAAAALLFAAFLRFARASLPAPALCMARQTLITCKVKLTN